MGAVRAGSILTAFIALTLPLMPVQAVLVRFSPRLARKLPHWYHRQVCRIVGVHLHIKGEVASKRPVLLVANHTSWLDVPVLSAVAPVSFVAKKEVSGWPFVSALARLQRSVFVDRERRSEVLASTSEILARLNAGDAIVLFAEGTSSDGNRVLPFKSSLFAAAKPPNRLAPEPTEAVVQTISIVYTRLCGIPLGRADRPRVGWYGDMEMQDHAWRLLGAGPLDVEVRIGPPVSLESFADRKELAEHTEREVRAGVVRRLRARAPQEPLDVAAPPRSSAPPTAAGRGRSRKWI
jgi:lyso-ornithine lipid O-acyltransferase